jgi:hypothetical protein
MIEIILEPIVCILRNLTGLKTYSYTLLITETSIQLRLEKEEFRCSFSIPWCTKLDFLMADILKEGPRSISLSLSTDCIQHLSSIPLKTCPDYARVTLRLVTETSTLVVPGYEEEYIVYMNFEDLPTPPQLELEIDLSNYSTLALLGKSLQYAVIASSSKSVAYWGVADTHLITHVHVLDGECDAGTISIGYTAMLANTFSKHKRLPNVLFKQDSSKLLMQASLLVKAGKDTIVVTYLAEGRGKSANELLDANLRSIQSEFSATYANTKGILATSSVQAIADYLKANPDEKLVHLARDSYLEAGDFTKYLLNSKHPIVKVCLLEDKFMVEYQLDQTSTYSVMLTTYQKVTSTK